MTPAGNNSGNSRNGVTRKTLKGDSARWNWKHRGTAFPQVLVQLCIVHMVRLSLNYFGSLRKASAWTMAELA
jgi:hypothetical protein